MAKCFLVLEDGTVMEGTGFGFEKTAYRRGRFQHRHDRLSGELDRPFLHGADPHHVLSSHRQLWRQLQVTSESGKVQVRGYRRQGELHRAVATCTAARRSDSLPEEEKVPGISELDTRSIIIKIRERGTLRGAIVLR